MIIELFNIVFVNDFLNVKSCEWCKVNFFWILFIVL